MRAGERGVGRGKWGEGAGERGGRGEGKRERAMKKCLVIVR